MKNSTYKLVVIRHGESEWNAQNRFTGWKDVDLAEKGIIEAQKAGKLLASKGYEFDVAYTSRLTRAIKTLNIVLDALNLAWIPVAKEWRLNERHYGALQGLNKAETAIKHSEEQVKIWRRSYDTPPPLMAASDREHPSHDARYNDVNPSDLPSGESLKDTVARVLPLWNQKISKDILAGKKVLIVAHGNSIRSLIQYFENMSPAEIMEVNVPTGEPLVYELDSDLKFVKKYYLSET